MKNMQVRLSSVFIVSILALAILSSCSGDYHPADPGNDKPGEMAEPEEAHAEPPVKEPSVMLYPGNPAPGDFTMLAVGPLPGGSEVKLEAGLPVTASPPYRDGGYTYLLLGAGFHVLPGSYTLTLKIEEPCGAVGQMEKTLEISHPDFDSISFNMPPGVGVGWTAQQLADDRVRVRQARLHTEAYPLWHQPFILPLEGRVSSRYGSIRIINRNPPSYHSGIDYAVPTGTPVKATNDGVVRLAASLLAYGNIVIIDHGLDISSSYLHLDSMSVTEGERVERGQVIGTVGATGFATGPHLHWEINLGLLPVNPLQLTRGDLNYLPTKTLSYR